MIYTWRCEKCKEITEVDRRMSDSGVPPDKCSHCKETKDLKKVILSPPPVPFEHLRNSGVFMDSNGNYPPRHV